MVSSFYFIDSNFKQNARKTDEWSLRCLKTDKLTDGPMDWPPGRLYQKLQKAFIILLQLLGVIIDFCKNIQGTQIRLLKSKTVYDSPISYLQQRNITLFDCGWFEILDIIFSSDI